MKETFPDNALSLLVDAELGDALVEALRRARRTAKLSQLLFFPGYVARFSRRGLFARPSPERALLDEFVAAASRGVDVRILLNQNTVIPDSVYGIRDACEGVPNLEVRGMALSMNLMHAKMLVVDGEEAVLPGPPFEQRFWDSPRHAYREPRREDKPPMHDLSLRLRGPAVASIDALFDALWRAAAPPLATAPPPRGPAPLAPAGPQTVRVARTLPRGLLDGEGERGILEAYLDALARAKRCVYIETQYFTSPTLTRALTAALARKPELQAILVVNDHADIPGYDRWQALRAKELGYPRHPRLGMFTLASPRRSGGRIRSVYIHSKLAIVDDEWATLGSANLDSISLEEAEEFGVVSEPNVDLNVVVLDGIEGAPRTGWVAQARRRVWAEHLGDEGVWDEEPPEGGWLAVWRQAAERNARRLREGRPLRGLVLPYEPGVRLPEAP